MTKKRTIHEVAFRLSYDLTQQIAPHIGKLEVKPAPLQIRAMRQIWSSESTTSQDIAVALKKDKSQVKRIVDELCAMELINRAPHPTDRRSKILQLTQKGNDFFTAIEAIEATFSQQLIEGISEQDLTTFFKVSDMLTANMQKMNK